MQASEPLQPNPDKKPLSNPSGGLPFQDPLLGYPPLDPTPIGYGQSQGSVGTRSRESIGARPSLHKHGQAIQRTGSRTPTTKAPTGPPLPKRPKGRLFVGSVLLGSLLMLAYVVYSSLLKYSAHGEIVGRTIDVAGPWPGVVKTIFVRQGDYVQQGQPIANILSLSMQKEVDQIDDLLRLAQAELVAEIAALKIEASGQSDNQQAVLSEYYEKWSELLWEKSKLSDLLSQHKRVEQLVHSGAESQQTFESLAQSVEGQQKRVERLSTSVALLKKLADKDSSDAMLWHDRTRPAIVQIEILQAKYQRMRKMLEAGEVKAPVSGRILSVRRFPGEYAHPNDPLVELLVQGSSEIMLYIHQESMDDFKVGSEAYVSIDPLSEQVLAVVTRLGPQMQSRPENLSSRYDSEDALIPVFLRPKNHNMLLGQFTQGSRVRLRRSLVSDPIKSFVGLFRSPKTTVADR